MPDTAVPEPARVLLVDSSAASLAAYTRQIGSLAEVETAASGEDALARLAAGERFAVVLCDLRLPGMEGMTLLRRFQADAPATVRVLFSGDADFGAAVEAMNSGLVFRLLQKPCLPATMKACLDGSIAQYRLQTLDREILERTVAGIVRLLAELMALASPASYQRARRLERSVGHMARARGLADVWQYELAALLSCLSTLVLEDDAFERFATGHPASVEERKTFAVQAAVAAALLAGVPRLDDIAAMVRGGGELLAGPGAAMPEAVEAGAALLAVASAYDVEITRGSTRDDALLRVTLQLQGRKALAPCLEALASVPADPPRAQVHGTEVAALTPGMILNAPIRTVSGVLLAAAGQPITPTLARLVQEYHRTVGVSQPLHVLEPVPGV